MNDDTPRKRRSVAIDHFTTGRLTAERLREEHLADLVALHRDAEVSRFLGGVRTPEVTKAYLVTNMAHWDQHGFGLWTLRTKDGAFAGRAGIRHVLVENVDEVEIFYAFKREFWRRGFASEIAAALTHRAVTAGAAVPYRNRERRQRSIPPRAGEIELSARAEHVPSRRGGRDLPHPAVNATQDGPRADRLCSFFNR